MPDEHPFTLRQIDLAHPDFAAIEDHLEFIKAQLARTPTRIELALIALGIITGTAGTVIGWFEVFWRACETRLSYGLVCT